MAHTKKNRKTEINEEKNVQSRTLRRSIRSSLVMYKYTALVERIPRFRSAAERSLPFFSFFSIFIVFHIYICIGPTRTLPKEGLVFHPLLTKIHIFFLYVHVAKSELGDTSARKSDRCMRSIITDSRVSIGQCWAILKNIRIQSICTRYTV